MSCDAVGKGSWLRRWQTWAIVLWAGSLLGVSMRVLCQPTSRTVYYPTYAEAGEHWRGGQDLYLAYGGYRYSPPVTVLFAALSYLPAGLAGVLWRLLGAGLLLGGLAWWCRVGLPRPLSSAQLALLYLLVAPLSLSSLNNGQANLLLAGLLVLAVSAAARARWNLVAVCLAMACLLKAYPLAIALLLLAAYPRPLSWRLPLALVAGLALPFLFQDASYVLDQYHNWLRNLKSDDRMGWSFDMSYRDMWLLFRLWGVPVGVKGYQFIQLAGGAAVALLCVAGRWAGWRPQRLLPTLLGLGCCWMMLFGPATESSTYALLAPSLGWAVLEAFTEPRLFWARAPVALSYLLLAGSFAAGWFPFGTYVHSAGIHPLGTLVLTGTLVIRALIGLARREPLAHADLPVRPAQAA
jgi:hypothetical protein